MLRLTKKQNEELDRLLADKVTQKGHFMAQGDVARTITDKLGKPEQELEEHQAEQPLETRKQFDDNVYNPPKNTAKRKVKKRHVKKHGDHDQRTHSPSGRAAIRQEQKEGKKPSGKDKKPAGGGKLPGRADAKGNKPGDAKYVNPDWSPDGPEPAFMQRAGAKVAHWIDSKVPGREKRLQAALPTGKGSDKPASPDNLNGYVNASYGRRKLLTSERAALGTKQGRKAFERQKRRQKKMTKRVTRKHGSHDQSSHAPGGGRSATPRSTAGTASQARAAVASKPKEGPSSPAPSKVKMRAKLRSTVDSIDAVLDGVDAGTRLYRELKEATDAIRSRLDENKKVTKADITKLHTVLSNSVAKGITHSLETLADSLRFVSDQEENKPLGDAKEKELESLIAELSGVVTYFSDVKDQGHFSKQDEENDDLSFTTPAVAQATRRQRQRPNAKGRGVKGYNI